MRAEYEKYKKIYYTISLHFVFCAMDRREIFGCEGTIDDFKKTCRKTCKELGIKIYQMECQDEFVHLFVELPPDISAQEALTKIKRTTATTLKNNYLKLKERESVWTWSALIATDEVFVDSDIQDFLKEQKASAKKERRESYCCKNAPPDGNEQGENRNKKR